MIAFAGGLVAATGVLMDVGLLDMTKYLLKEGSTISSFPFGVNPVYWLTIGRAGRVCGLPARAASYLLGLRCARRP